MKINMHNSFLLELIHDKIFICPVCQHDQWELRSEQLLCLSCKKIWPVRHGVPDLYNRYKAVHDQAFSCEDLEKTNAQIVDHLISVLDLDQETCREAVLSILNRTNGLSAMDDALTAEIQDVMDRFFPAPETGVTAVPADANKAPYILLERHYFPDQMLPGSKITANVRVKNIGFYPWSSRTDVPLLLVVSWMSKQRKNFFLQSPPVRFPVDIAPKRSITMPVSVSAPLRTGMYELTVCLVNKTGQVLTKADKPILVTVKSRSLKDRIKQIFNFERKIVSPVSYQKNLPYDQDHEIGRAVFEAELKKKPRFTRVLEIGSGVHPQTAWVTNSKTVALDISAPLLELGSLYFSRKQLNSKVAFVCANGYFPPFKSGSFDAVVLFSTLHHFPEPEMVLKNTARLLKKDGFVAVMCEPVNDTLEGKETIRELRKGINEQVFTWSEYKRIFDMAGLHPSYVQIDGGSLKAILK